MSENLIKRVTVTFDFDPAEELVSNLNCFIDGVERKKTTTKSAKSAKVEPVLEDEALLTLEATKLAFNNKAVADIGIVYGDRIVIKYEKVKGQKSPIPLIGKDIDFNEEGGGNKITKTNTIAYRGKANTVLAEYGTEFGLEEYKTGVWRLVSKNEPVKADKPVKDKTYEEIVENAEDLDLTVLTDEDTTIDLSEVQFKL